MLKLSTAATPAARPAPTAAEGSRYTIQRGDTISRIAARFNVSTQALLSAALPDHPDLARKEVILQGDVAAATDVPRGCRLHPRCPAAMAVCSQVEPEWKQVTPKHWSACHLY